MSSIRDCKIGDVIVVNGRLHTIVNETKTQWKAQPYGKTGLMAPTYSIRKDSGKIIGEHGWAWKLDETPEAFIAKVDARNAAKKTEAEERRARWEAKVQAVRDANPLVVATDEGPGLRKAILQNSKHEPVIVFFSTREDKILDFNSPSHYRDAVRLSCSVWAKHWSHDYEMSSTSVTAENLKEALYELVASYWD